MRCPVCDSIYNHTLVCECGHRWMLDEVDDPDDYIKMRFDEYCDRWVKAVTVARRLATDISHRLEGHDEDVERLNSFRSTVKCFMEASECLPNNDWFRYDAQVNNDELEDIVNLMMVSSIPVSAPRQYGIDVDTIIIIKSFIKWVAGPFEDLLQYDLRYIKPDTFMKSFYHLKINRDSFPSNVPCPVMIASQPDSNHLQGWNLFQIMTNELRSRWMNGANKTLDECYRYLCLIDRLSYMLGPDNQSDIDFIRNELYKCGYVGHGSVFMSEEVMRARNDRRIPSYYNLFVCRDGKWIEYDGGEIDQITLRLI